MGEWRSFEEWLTSVPPAVTGEEMWRFFGYQKALFLYDVCWKDCEKLVAHPLGKPVAQQLIRSAGSISANIEEGFGRGFGKSRDNFLRIAIGSARESKGWYYRAKALLAPQILEHRLSLLSEITALLITELNRNRKAPN